MRSQGVVMLAVGLGVTACGGGSRWRRCSRPNGAAEHASEAASCRANVHDGMAARMSTRTPVVNKELWSLLKSPESGGRFRSVGGRGVPRGQCADVARAPGHGRHARGAPRSRPFFSRRAFFSPARLFWPPGQPNTQIPLILAWIGNPFPNPCDPPSVQCGVGGHKK